MAGAHPVLQAMIRTEVDANGKLGDAYWLDVSRLKVTSKSPVMEAPDFDFGPVVGGEKGPASKAHNSRW